GRSRGGGWEGLGDGDFAVGLDVLRARFEPQYVPLVELKLGRVLDGHDPVLVGDRRRKGVQQGRLPATCTARDEDVQLGQNAALQVLDGLGVEGADLDHLVERQPLLAEFPDRDQRTAEAERRDDDVYAAAVRAT